MKLKKEYMSQQSTYSNDRKQIEMNKKNVERMMR